MGTPHTPEPTNPPTGPIVLCIDDDELVLRFLRDFLTAHGYRALTVTDGLPGLELAQQTRPDVILLDIMLRGLSGYDICRKFRADPAFHNVPIILLTVLDEPSVATIGRAAGADLILHKPADPEAIVRAIEWMLGRKRDAPPA
jgi:DNA-binding response OmpR family regulator